MRLALRGPMARDLREILAGLRIPADIERIGDYAANVAKRSIALGKVPPLPQIQGLRALGRLAAQQVRRAIAAATTMLMPRWNCVRTTPAWTRSTPRCSASC